MSSSTTPTTTTNNNRPPEDVTDLTTDVTRGKGFNPSTATDQQTRSLSAHLQQELKRMQQTTTSKSKIPPPLPLPPARPRYDVRVTLSVTFNPMTIYVCCINNMFPNEIMWAKIVAPKISFLIDSLKERLHEVALDQGYIQGHKAAIDAEFGISSAEQTVIPKGSGVSIVRRAAVSELRRSKWMEEEIVALNQEWSTKKEIGNNNNNINSSNNNTSSAKLLRQASINQTSKSAQIAEEAATAYRERPDLVLVEALEPFFRRKEELDKDKARRLPLEYFSDKNKEQSSSNKSSNNTNSNNKNKNNSNTVTSLAATSKLTARQKVEQELEDMDENNISSLQKAKNTFYGYKMAKESEPSKSNNNDENENGNKTTDDSNQNDGGDGKQKKKKDEEEDDNSKASSSSLPDYMPKYQVCQKLSLPAQMRFNDLAQSVILAEIIETCCDYDHQDPNAVKEKRRISNDESKQPLLWTLVLVHTSTHSPIAGTAGLILPIASAGNSELGTDPSVVQIGGGSQEQRIVTTLTFEWTVPASWAEVYETKKKLNVMEVEDDEDDSDLDQLDDIEEAEYNDDKKNNSSQAHQSDSSAANQGSNKNTNESASATKISTNDIGKIEDDDKKRKMRLAKIKSEKMIKLLNKHEKSGADAQGTTKNDLDTILEEDGGFKKPTITALPSSSTDGEKQSEHSTAVELQQQEEQQNNKIKSSSEEDQKRQLVLSHHGSLPAKDSWFPPKHQTWSLAQVRWKRRRLMRHASNNNARELYSRIYSAIAAHNGDIRKIPPFLLDALTVLCEIESGSIRADSVDERRRAPLLWMLENASRLPREVLREAVLTLIDLGTPTFLCQSTYSRLFPGESFKTVIDVLRTNPIAKEVVLDCQIRIASRLQNAAALSMKTDINNNNKLLAMNSSNSHQNPNNISTASSKQQQQSSSSQPQMASLKNPVLDIPPGRCRFACFSATKEHVVYTVSPEGRLLLWDIKLRNCIEMAITQPGSRVFVIPLFPLTKKGQTLRQRLTVCHPHAETDMLLLSSGEIITVDFANTAGPRVNVAAKTQVKPDLFEGDGQGWCCSFAWNTTDYMAKPKAEIDRATRVAKHLRELGTRTDILRSDDELRTRNAESAAASLSKAIGNSGDYHQQQQQNKGNNDGKNKLGNNNNNKKDDGSSNKDNNNSNNNDSSMMMFAPDSRTNTYTEILPPGVISARDSHIEFGRRLVMYPYGQSAALAESYDDGEFEAEMLRQKRGGKKTLRKDFHQGNDDDENEEEEEESDDDNDENEGTSSLDMIERSSALKRSDEDEAVRNMIGKTVQSHPDHQQHKKKKKQLKLKSQKNKNISSNVSINQNLLPPKEKGAENNENTNNNDSDAGAGGEAMTRTASQRNQGAGLQRRSASVRFVDNINKGTSGDSNPTSPTSSSSKNPSFRSRTAPNGNNSRVSSFRSRFPATQSNNNNTTASRNQKNLLRHNRGKIPPSPIAVLAVVIDSRPIVLHLRASVFAHLDVTASIDRRAKLLAEAIDESLKCVEDRREDLLIVDDGSPQYGSPATSFYNNNNNSITTAGSRAGSSMMKRQQSSLSTEKNKNELHSSTNEDTSILDAITSQMVESDDDGEGEEENPKNDQDKNNDNNDDDDGGDNVNNANNTHHLRHTSSRATITTYTPDDENNNNFNSFRSTASSSSNLKNSLHVDSYGTACPEKYVTGLVFSASAASTNDPVLFAMADGNLIEYRTQTRTFNVFKSSLKLDQLPQDGPAETAVFRIARGHATCCVVAPIMPDPAERAYAIEKGLTANVTTSLCAWCGKDFSVSTSTIDNDCDQQKDPKTPSPIFEPYVTVPDDAADSERTTGFVFPHLFSKQDEFYSHLLVFVRRGELCVLDTRRSSRVLRLLRIEATETELVLRRRLGDVFDDNEEAALSSGLKICNVSNEGNMILVTCRDFDSAAVFHADVLKDAISRAIVAGLPSRHRELELISQSVIDEESQKRQQQQLALKKKLRKNRKKLFGSKGGDGNNNANNITSSDDEDDAEGGLSSGAGGGSSASAMPKESLLSFWSRFVCPDKASFASKCQHIGFFMRLLEIAIKGSHATTSAITSGETDADTTITASSTNEHNDYGAHHATATSSTSNTKIKIKAGTVGIHARDGKGGTIFHSFSSILMDWDLSVFSIDVARRWLTILLQHRVNFWIPCNDYRPVDAFRSDDYVFELGDVFKRENAIQEHFLSSMNFLLNNNDILSPTTTIACEPSCICDYEDYVKVAALNDYDNANNNNRDEYGTNHRNDNHHHQQSVIVNNAQTGGSQLVLGNSGKVFVAFGGRLFCLVPYVDSTDDNDDRKKKKVPKHTTTTAAAGKKSTTSPPSLQNSASIADDDDFAHNSLVGSVRYSESNIKSNNNGGKSSTKDQKEKKQHQQQSYNTNINRNSSSSSSSSSSVKKKLLYVCSLPGERNTPFIAVRHSDLLEKSNSDLLLLEDGTVIVVSIAPRKKPSDHLFDEADENNSSNNNIFGSGGIDFTASSLNMFASSFALPSMSSFTNNNINDNAAGGLPNSNATSFTVDYETFSLVDNILLKKFKDKFDNRNNDAGQLPCGILKASVRAVNLHPEESIFFNQHHHQEDNNTNNNNNTNNGHRAEKSNNKNTGKKNAYDHINVHSNNNHNHNHPHDEEVTFHDVTTNPQYLENMNDFSEEFTTTSLTTFFTIATREKNREEACIEIVSRVVAATITAPPHTLNCKEISRLLQLALNEAFSSQQLSSAVATKFSPTTHSRDIFLAENCTIREQTDKSKQRSKEQQQQQRDNNDSSVTITSTSSLLHLLPNHINVLGLALIGKYNSSNISNNNNNSSDEQYNYNHNHQEQQQLVPEFEGFSWSFNTKYANRAAPGELIVLDAGSWPTGPCKGFSKLNTNRAESKQTASKTTKTVCQTIVTAQADFLISLNRGPELFVFRRSPKSAHASSLLLPSLHLDPEPDAAFTSEAVQCCWGSRRQKHFSDHSNNNNNNNSTHTNNTSAQQSEKRRDSKHHHHHHHQSSSTTHHHHFSPLGAEEEEQQQIEMIGERSEALYILRDGLLLVYDVQTELLLILGKVTRSRQEYERLRRCEPEIMATLSYNNGNEEEFIKRNHFSGDDLKNERELFDPTLASGEEMLVWDDTNDLDDLRTSALLDHLYHQDYEKQLQKFEEEKRSRIVSEFEKLGYFVNDFLSSSFTFGDDNNNNNSNALFGSSTSFSHSSPTSASSPSADLIKRISENIEREMLMTTGLPVRQQKEFSTNHIVFHPKNNSYFKYTEASVKGSLLPPLLHVDSIFRISLTHGFVSTIALRSENVMSFIESDAPPLLLCHRAVPSRIPRPIPTKLLRSSYAMRSSSMFSVDATTTETGRKQSLSSSSSSPSSWITPYLIESCGDIIPRQKGVTLLLDDDTVIDNDEDEPSMQEMIDPDAFLVEQARSIAEETAPIRSAIRDGDGLLPFYIFGEWLRETINKNINSNYHQKEKWERRALMWCRRLLFLGHSPYLSASQNRIPLPSSSMNNNNDNNIVAVTRNDCAAIHYSKELAPLLSKITKEASMKRPEVAVVHCPIQIFNGGEFIDDNDDDTDTDDNDDNKGTGKAKQDNENSPNVKITSIVTQMSWSCARSGMAYLMTEDGGLSLCVWIEEEQGDESDQDGDQGQSSSSKKFVVKQIKRQLLPPFTLNQGITMFVTSMRDYSQIEEMAKQRSDPIKNLQDHFSVPPLTWQLSQVSEDILLFSDGTIYSVRIDESRNFFHASVEKLMRPVTDYRQDDDYDAEKVEGLHFRWKSSRNFMEHHHHQHHQHQHHDQTKLRNAGHLHNGSVEGVEAKWLETVNVNPVTPCCTLVCGTEKPNGNVALAFRHLYPPSGISTLFPRHVPTMLQESLYRTQQQQHHQQQQQNSTASASLLSSSPSSLIHLEADETWLTPQLTHEHQVSDLARHRTTIRFLSRTHQNNSNNNKHQQTNRWCIAGGCYAGGCWIVDEIFNSSTNKIQLFCRRRLQFSWRHPQAVGRTRGFPVEFLMCKDLTLPDTFKSAIIAAGFAEGGLSVSAYRNPPTLSNSKTSLSEQRQSSATPTPMESRCDAVPSSVFQNDFGAAPTNAPLCYGAQHPHEPIVVSLANDAKQLVILDWQRETLHTVDIARYTKKRQVVMERTLTVQEKQDEELDLASSGCIIKFSACGKFLSLYWLHLKSVFVFNFSDILWNQKSKRPFILSRRNPRAHARANKRFISQMKAGGGTAKTIEEAYSTKSDMMTDRINNIDDHDVHNNNDDDSLPSELPASARKRAQLRATNLVTTNDTNKAVGFSSSSAPPPLLVDPVLSEVVSAFKNAAKMGTIIPHLSRDAENCSWLHRAASQLCYILAKKSSMMIDQKKKKKKKSNNNDDDHENDNEKLRSLEKQATRDVIMAIEFGCGLFCFNSAQVRPFDELIRVLEYKTPAHHQNENTSASISSSKNKKHSNSSNKLEPILDLIVHNWSYRNNVSNSILIEDKDGTSTSHYHHHSLLPNPHTLITRFLSRLNACHPAGFDYHSFRDSTFAPSSFRTTHTNQSSNPEVSNSINNGNSEVLVQFDDETVLSYVEALELTISVKFTITTVFDDDVLHSNDTDEHDKNSGSNHKYPAAQQMTNNHQNNSASTFDDHNVPRQENNGTTMMTFSEIDCTNSSFDGIASVAHTPRKLQPRKRIFQYNSEPQIVIRRKGIIVDTVLNMKSKSFQTSTSGAGHNLVVATQRNRSLNLHSQHHHLLTPTSTTSTAMAGGTTNFLVSGNQQEDNSSSNHHKLQNSTLLTSTSLAAKFRARNSTRKRSPTSTKMNTTNVNASIRLIGDGGINNTFASSSGLTNSNLPPATPVTPASIMNSRNNKPRGSGISAFDEKSRNNNNNNNNNSYYDNDDEENLDSTRNFDSADENDDESNIKNSDRRQISQSDIYEIIHEYKKEIEKPQCAVLPCGSSSSFLLVFISHSSFEGFCMVDLSVQLEQQKMKESWKIGRTVNLHNNNNNRKSGRNVTKTVIDEIDTDPNHHDASSMPIAALWTSDLREMNSAPCKRCFMSVSKSTSSNNNNNKHHEESSSSSSSISSFDLNLFLHFASRNTFIADRLSCFSCSIPGFTLFKAEDLDNVLSLLASKYSTALTSSTTATNTTSDDQQTQHSTNNNSTSNSKIKKKEKLAYWKTSSILHTVGRQATQLFSFASVAAAAANHQHQNVSSSSSPDVSHFAVNRIAVCSKTSNIAVKFFGGSVVFYPFHQKLGDDRGQFQLSTSSAASSSTLQPVRFDVESCFRTALEDCENVKKKQLLLCSSLEKHDENEEQTKNREEIEFFCEAIAVDNNTVVAAFDSSCDNGSSSSSPGCSFITIWEVYSTKDNSGIVTRNNKSSPLLEKSQNGEEKSSSVNTTFGVRKAQAPLGNDVGKVLHLIIHQPTNDTTNSPSSSSASGMNNNNNNRTNSTNQHRDVGSINNSNNASISSTMRNNDNSIKVSSGGDPEQQEATVTMLYQSSDGSSKGVCHNIVRSKTFSLVDLKVKANPESSIEATSSADDNEAGGQLENNQVEFNRFTSNMDNVIEYYSSSSCSPLSASNDQNNNNNSNIQTCPSSRVIEMFETTEMVRKPILAVTTSVRGELLEEHLHHV